MNSVLIRNPNPRGRYPVTYVESDEMDESFLELRADVRNLQIHVADIRAEVRATNSRLDGLRDRIDQEFGSFRNRIDHELGSLRNKIEQDFSSLRDRIDQGLEKLRLETKADLGAIRKEMAEFRDSLQAQINKLTEKLDKAIAWALGLYLTGMGLLLTVMAHGFKWI
jgi:predicted  nucleic acid-binding Zn-ribbon protein